ncbi:hypothetical protein [Methanosarcina barkeri]|nr:hypothetical protein [Methanosarcina barkeri]
MVQKTDTESPVQGKDVRIRKKPIISYDKYGEEEQKTFYGE